MSADRGTICIYCGYALPYKEGDPIEPVFAKALAHDAECPKNPHIATIARLRAELAEARTTERGRIVDELHRRCGRCLVCGKRRCEHPATTLPETMNTGDVLAAINLACLAPVPGNPRCVAESGENATQGGGDG